MGVEEKKSNPLSQGQIIRKKTFLEMGDAR